MDKVENMRAVSVRVDADIKARWDRLASEHGLNQSQLMREALIEKLEELEDFYTVRARLAEPFEPVPNEEVWRRLGVEN
jgi:RHH-type rel operon transcriptional repressor/antitoxin RelB